MQLLMTLYVCVVFVVTMLISYILLKDVKNYGVKLIIKTLIFGVLYSLTHSLVWQYLYGYHHLQRLMDREPRVKIIRKIVTN